MFFSLGIMPTSLLRKMQKKMMESAAWLDQIQSDTHHRSCLDCQEAKK